MSYPERFYKECKDQGIGIIDITVDSEGRLVEKISDELTELEVKEAIKPIKLVKS